MSKLGFYGHAKPLLVPKGQKTIPIIETSENKAILESIRQMVVTKQL
jgi:hypothetical protein